MAGASPASRRDRCGGADGLGEDAGAAAVWDGAGAGATVSGGVGVGLTTGIVPDVVTPLRATPNYWMMDCVGGLGCVGSNGTVAGTALCGAGAWGAGVAARPKTLASTTELSDAIWPWGCAPEG